MKLGIAIARDAQSTRRSRRSWSRSRRLRPARELHRCRDRESGTATPVAPAAPRATLRIRSRCMSSAARSAAPTRTVPSASAVHQLVRRGNGNLDRDRVDGDGLEAGVLQQRAEHDVVREPEERGAGGSLSRRGTSAFATAPSTAAKKGVRSAASQLDNAMRPPGARTRFSSRAARPGSRCAG